jgi:hypothetical protein
MLLKGQPCYYFLGLPQIKHIFNFSVVRKYAMKSNGTEEENYQNLERFLKLFNFIKLNLKLRQYYHCERNNLNTYL